VGSIIPQNEAASLQKQPRTRTRRYCSIT